MYVISMCFTFSGGAEDCLKTTYPASSDDKAGVWMDK